MVKDEANHITRHKVEKDLREFIQRQGSSGLVYFRGRRRVGKTTLLKKIQAELPNVFYFVGAPDEGNRETLSRFAKSWDAFLGSNSLSRIKQSELDWPSCFAEFDILAGTRLKSTNLTIIFDEIQWLAKSRSGFIGLLKDHWLTWESLGNIKLIICGSSNKFFIEQSGGEEKTLRGLKTQSDIILPPLNALEVRNHYFKSWSTDEVLMLYMMLGGIPYYLNQLPQDQGFIRTINSAVFTRKTIFLDEADEILNLEFNNAGVQSTKSILSAMGPLGSSASQILSRIQVSEAGLSDSLKKLHDYSIIHQRKVFNPSSKKKTGQIYFYNDPYLLFYFACLEKLQVAIRDNEASLLITNLITSERSLYISNFSGRAFEVLVRNALLAEKTDFQMQLFKAIGVDSREFELYDSIDGGSSVDLLLDHKKQRTYFMIECKWCHSQEIIADGINQLSIVKSPLPSKRAERIVVTNYKPTKSLERLAKEKGIRIVWMGDLFG